MRHPCPQLRSYFALQPTDVDEGHELDMSPHMIEPHLLCRGSTKGIQQNFTVDLPRTTSGQQQMTFIVPLEERQEIVPYLAEKMFGAATVVLVKPPQGTLSKT